MPVSRFRAGVFAALLAAPVFAEPSLDPASKAILRRAEFEQMAVSPNGQLVALARRDERGSVVSVNRVDTLEAVRTVDPGKRGEIDTLRWLDDGHLLVGAARTSSVYGMALADPTLFIVPIAKDEAVYTLPDNFVATIVDDPGHLLVSKCNYKAGDGCVIEIRKVEIGKLRKEGEPLVSAPDTRALPMPDRYGRVRFAIGFEKDGTSRTWVLGEDGKTWNQINDEAKSGLTVYPAGVAGDGKSGILISEREQGTSAVERYDFATGKRQELVRDAASDPLGLIYDVGTQAPIGAWFGATRPRPLFWEPAHPQARLLAELMKLFPGTLPTITSTSRDGQLATVVVVSDRDAGSFYLVDRKAGKARLFGRSRDWLEPQALAASREFELKARDGLVLHGLLTIPAGASGRNLPLVVLPHGGPYWMNDGWSFDEEVQLLASQGFAVLRVNFRGSGGYGKDFINRGMRQWGKAMQDDVTDATRWAIAQGIADPQRVCIYGSSYGAYAAMMGTIREPGLYRCAAGYAGVYDLNKLYKWDSLRRSDLGMEFLHRAIGTDKADLAANSPAQRAGEIRANVFLAHGTRDGIADVKFARMMERAMNAGKGRKVDLIEYQYQGHGVVLAEQREDFYARLLAFLHANLDSPPAD